MIRPLARNSIAEPIAIRAPASIDGHGADPW